MTAGMITVPTIMPLKEPGSILAGSRKWMIDTETLVDIHTSSRDCLLFYTLDSTKPDPFKKIHSKNQTTYQFTNPFTLKTGKRTVKAVAVLKDGSKESNVNTKVFQVSEPEVVSDDESINKTNTSWTTQNDSETETDDMVQRKLFKNVLRESAGGKPNKQGMQNNVIKKVMTDSPRPPAHPPIHTSNEDDSFRCIHCNTERPRDPYARFCNGCGRTLPPAPGGIRTSQYFHATVNCDRCGYEKASESSFCKVCDSMTKFNKPLKQRINCTNCDSMNPATVENCLVCDQNLDNKLLQNNMINKSIIHKPCNDFIRCPFCERTNSGDARFCDWCGKKPQTSPRTYLCHECRAENTLYSEYCCSCSTTLKAPVRKSFEDTLSSGNFTVEDSDDLNTSNDADSNSEPWKNINLKKVPKRLSKNVSTQAGEELTPITPLSKSKLNPSFNFSPGKGYWRQQVEHVCHHLKIYTQNNLEFRECIGNYVMSRMMSGIVTASDESQVVLTATFALKDERKKNKRTTNGGADALTFINALTSNQKRSSIQSTKSLLGSRPTSARSRPGSARSRPSSAKSTSSKAGSTRRKKTSQKFKFEKLEKEKITEKLSKLSSENLKFLNMIKSSKVIDEEKVEDLMNSENFDANTADENDIPLLKLSVINKHYAMIPLLVNSGAHVDKTSGMKENSALHEAVLLGIYGKAAVSTLIENGASADLKDKKGQSAFDIAVDSGIESLIEKFTKLTSKQMLDDVRL